MTLKNALVEIVLEQDPCKGCRPASQPCIHRFTKIPIWDEFWTLLGRSPGCIFASRLERDLELRSTSLIGESG